MELAPGNTDTEGGPLWSWGPNEASLDKSHPVRGTAGLQARDSAPSQEEATGRRLSGQPSMHTTSPSPAWDALDRSVLGFCWKRTDYGSKAANNGKIKYGQTATESWEPSIRSSTCPSTLLAPTDPRHEGKGPPRPSQEHVASGCITAVASPLMLSEQAQTPDSARKPARAESRPSTLCTRLSRR